MKVEQLDKRDNEYYRYGVSAHDYARILIKDAVPAIFIDSDKHISVANGIITVEDSRIYLWGATIAEVVNSLISLGVNAKITRRSVAFMPAIMLLLMDSAEIIDPEVDEVPFNLSLVHSQFAAHLLSLDSENYSREVKMVYDKNTKAIINEFHVENEKLFVNKDSESEYKALIEYSMRKYFLFAAKENIINPSKLIKQNLQSPSLKELLISSNFSNRNFA